MGLARRGGWLCVVPDEEGREGARSDWSVRQVDKIWVDGEPLVEGSGERIRGATVDGGCRHMSQGIAEGRSICALVARGRDLCFWCW